MTKLNLNLLQNGLDSLKHSVEHYLDKNEYSLKYSILHLAHSVELFLKERLSREHKLLIFSKPEISNEDSKTVTIDESIKRLAAAGVNLKKEARLAFEELYRTRNKIQHFEINLTRKDVESEMGRNIKYIIEFLKEELAISLEDKIPEYLFSPLRAAIYSYEELNELCNYEIKLFCEKNKIKSEAELCASCGHFSIIFPDPRYSSNDKVKCFYCNNVLEVYRCQKCGITYYLTENIYHDCSLTNYTFEMN